MPTAKSIRMIARTEVVPLAKFDPQGSVASCTICDLQRQITNRDTDLNLASELQERLLRNRRRAAALLDELIQFVFEPERLPALQCNWHVGIA